MTDVKKCTKCEEVLDVSEFYKRGKSTRSACKKCEREYSRQYQAANPEKKAERDRRRRLEDPDGVRAKEARRLARRRAHGLTPQKLRDLVVETYGECAVCGTKDDLSLDHIKPVSDGGTDEWDNLQALCYKHNRIKFTKEIDYRKNPLPDPRVTNE